MRKPRRVYDDYNRFYIDTPDGKPKQYSKTRQSHYLWIGTDCEFLGSISKRTSLRGLRKMIDFILGDQKEKDGQK